MHEKKNAKKRILFACFHVLQIFVFITFLPFSASPKSSDTESHSPATEDSHSDSRTESFFPECESISTPDRVETPSLLRTIPHAAQRMRNAPRRDIPPPIFPNPHALTDTRILREIPRPDRREISRIKRFDTQTVSLLFPQIPIS